MQEKIVTERMNITKDMISEEQRVFSGGTGCVNQIFSVKMVAAMYIAKKKRKKCIQHSWT